MQRPSNVKPISKNKPSGPAPVTSLATASKASGTAATGGPVKKAASLSSLQAALRNKDTSGSPSAANSPDSLKRKLSNDAPTPQAKKLVKVMPSAAPGQPGVLAAKSKSLGVASTSKSSSFGTPSGPHPPKGPPPSVRPAGGSPGPHSPGPHPPLKKVKSSSPLAMKTVGGTLPPSLEKRPPTSAPASVPVAVQSKQAAVNNHAAPDAGAEPRPQGTPQPVANPFQSGFGQAMKALDAAPPTLKMKHLGKVAEVFGQQLQVEHINYFLQSLKATMLKRAQGDGVRSPRQSPPTAASTAAPKPPSGPPPKDPRVETPKPAPPPKPPPKPTPTATKGAPPPSATKSPVTKAPVTKAPVTKAPTATAQKGSSPGLPPGLKPQQPAKPKAPTRAPAADTNGIGEGEGSQSPLAPNSPMGQSDPLYVLVGEFAEDPVCEDGSIKEERLKQVLDRLWSGIAKKPKDWVAAWQAMVIPADQQSVALQSFINMAFGKNEGVEYAGQIVAELVKSHKVKMRSVEEVLSAFGGNLEGIMMMNETAWKLYSVYCLHVYPKPAGSGWGWSRVGWSWLTWWQYVERCLQSLEGARAFEVLLLILKMIQEKEGVTLSEIQTWLDGDKIPKVLRRLAELSDLDEGAVNARLAEEGIVAES